MIAAMCAAEESGMTEEQFVEAARKVYISYAHALGGVLVIRGKISDRRVP